MKKRWGARLAWGLLLLTSSAALVTPLVVGSTETAPDREIEFQGEDTVFVRGHIWEVRSASQLAQLYAGKNYVGEPFWLARVGDVDTPDHMLLVVSEMPLENDTTIIGYMAHRNLTWKCEDVIFDQRSAAPRPHFETPEFTEPDVQVGCEVFEDAWYLVQQVEEEDLTTVGVATLALGIIAATVDILVVVGCIHHRRLESESSPSTSRFA